MERPEGAYTMKRRIEVNDILIEFLADFEESGEEALRRYVEKYPELAETLQRRAGILRMFSRLPDTELNAEEEQTLNLRAASVVQNLIFEMRAPADATVSEPAGEDEKVPFASLLDRLGSIGETLESVAEKLRLSDVILHKLDKRRMRPETVPRLLYEKLAEILGTTYGEIYSYATLAPTASGGHFKASSTPVVPQQAEFSELVKWDPDMNEEDKNYWLALPPSGKDSSLEGTF
jgi:hypothetical protein